MSRPSHLAGVLASIVSSIGFASMDAIAKLLLQSVPVGWVLVLRGAAIIVIISLTLLVMRRLDWFGSSAPRVLALRSIVFGITSVLVVVSLAHLTLAEAISLYFLSPIATVFLARWLLGEPLTRRALVAVVLGFIGVLAIIQPRSQGVSWFYALPLIAAVTGALQDVLVRRMRASAHPSTIVLYGSVATIIATALVLPLGAPPPLDSRELGLFTAGAIAGAVGFFFVAVSFQKAPTRIISPLRYLNVVWAVVLGFAVFGTVPNALAASGIVLVMIAGIVCVWTPRNA